MSEKILSGTKNSKQRKKQKPCFLIEAGCLFLFVAYIPLGNISIIIKKKRQVVDIDVQRRLDGQQKEPRLYFLDVDLISNKLSVSNDTYKRYIS